MVVATANLTMKYSVNKVLVWATDAQSGTPIANAAITLYDKDFQSVKTGTTDKDGLVTMEIPQVSDLYQPMFAVLQADGQFGLGFAGASRVQPVAGLALILALAYCLSSARHSIDYRTVAWGLGLQFVFALIVLKTDAGRAVFQSAGGVITQILNFAYVGSSFVFGPLGNPEVWPRVMTGALGAEGAQYASVFAFQVLPTIIFIAALFAMLYYFGVMQLIVRLFAVIMQRFMRASGAESLNVAASIFMGQTEAPLTIRPFIPRMTESELMTIMTAGMAHISGGIMAAYILFGVKAEHLLTAVIMTAPGTLMMAKIFVPET